jgi:membrane-anchored protein YejM (alkaline phosphatase superfamily)
MERRRFVLSWGRKIFFGLGWPLLCILGLVYLKSGVIPKDTPSLIYYVFTNFGFFGFLTIILYFALYVPLAIMFPTYYFVRLWSAFLILITSSAILLDGLVFGEYRFHINQLIVSIFSFQGPTQVFNGSVSPYVVTAGIIVFLFFVLWIRGEWLWRVMQRKFSNPVKNWYFPVILICLGLSHVIWNNHRTSFYGNEITLGSLFPLNYQEIFFPKVLSTSMMGKGNLNYPNAEMKCAPKSLPNIIFIVMENFGTNSISEDGTPFVRHLQQHGMNFNMHLSGGGNQDDSLFRLIYGIPALYRPEAQNSVMIDQLKKSGYEISIFSERRIPGLQGPKADWMTWIESRKNAEGSRPAFLFFDLVAAIPEEMDLKLKDTVNKLESGKLLTGSTIVLTGTNSSEWDPVPLTFIVPDREKGEWAHRTSHYDVVPTIMKNILKCKTPVRAYSFGKELRESPAKDWEIFGNEKSFRIVDFTNRNIIESDWQGRILSGGSARNDLVLEASREISRFYRR